MRNPGATRDIQERVHVAGMIGLIGIEPTTMKLDYILCMLQPGAAFKAASFLRDRM